MPPALRALLAALTVLAAARCASLEPQPQSLSERLVHRPAPGAPASEAPSFDVPGAPPPVVHAPDTTSLAGLTVRPKTSTLPTLETENPDLARLLAAVKPGDSASYHAVAHEYRRLGVYDLASDYFTRALAIDAHDAAAYDGRARSWRDWGYPGEGLGDAYRAVALAPDSPIANNTLGTLLLAVGEVSAAEARFERALALDAGADYARANLCRVAAGTDDAEKRARYCSR